jgi:5-methyltetrahydrofolate--homocysteine methyltransferase
LNSPLQTPGEWNSPLQAEHELYQSVIKGRTATIEDNIKELIKSMQPLEIINSILIPAMQEVGVLFEKGKIQLPFVLKSAEIMKRSVDFMTPYMPEKSKSNEETMLLATVQGDVHDIGKNLVEIILENNGYAVIDLGVKQSAQNICQAVKEHKPTCLGMSALLIKSTEYMKETLKYLKENKIAIPVICGGAALNAEFVEKELQSVYDGKVVFGKDAFAGLRFMQELAGL